MSDLSIRGTLNFASDYFNDIAIEDGLVGETGYLSDSPIDAFRHAATSAALSSVTGAHIAAVLGSLNEAINGASGSRSNTMDEFNNYIGRELIDHFDAVAGPGESTDPVDHLLDMVRAGITINSINDPRIDVIEANLLPGETIADMLARTGGTVQGPTGEFDLTDPRGPYQDPNRLEVNVRDPLAPDSSPRPVARPGSDGSGASDGTDPSEGGTSPSGGGNGSNGISDGGYYGPGGHGGNHGTPTGPSGSDPTTHGFEDGDPRSGTNQPIILDLDGDGIEVAFGGATFFDVDEDGYLEQTSWAGADDGLLVIDLNADGSIGDGDGVIDQARELAFALWTDAEDTDLEALATATDDDGNLIFDSNGDGVLNSDDDVWDALRVWQDANQNGVVDDGELMLLGEVDVTHEDGNGDPTTTTGITEISLGYDDGSAYSDTDDDISVFGNTLHGLGSFIVTGGTEVEGGVGDVSLDYNTYGWRQVDTDIGYNIEFETGVQYRYAVIEAGDAADVDLTSANLNGATGDSRNNSLTAIGHILNVVVSGGSGNDTIAGGVQDDLLSGDEGADELRGGEGDDLLFIDAQDTVIEGGDGYDTAFVATEGAVTLDLASSGIEQAYGNDGDDVFTGSGSDIDVALHGGDGNDDLTGGNSDDILSGGEGHDTISAGSGDDYVTGGVGDDLLQGGAGDDLIFGGDGADTVEGEAGDDLIFGGEGDDSLEGGAGDDSIEGGAENDTLHGGVGDDTLSGGEGDDHLYDDDGDDRLEGGDGDDTFYLTQSSTEDSFDIFLGGEGDDTLVLSGNQSDWTWSYVEYTGPIRDQGGGGRLAEAGPMSMHRKLLRLGSTVSPMARNTSMSWMWRRLPSRGMALQ